MSNLENNNATSGQSNSTTLQTDPFQSTRTFREQAESEGLIIPGDEIKGIKFYFDLGAGRFFASADTAKIIRILEISKDYAFRDEGREHNVLLNLVAEKAYLTEDSVIWYRPEQVDAHSNPDKWVTLRKHLEEAGCDVQTVIYREEQISLGSNLDSLAGATLSSNEIRGQESNTISQSLVEWSMSYPYCSQIQGSEINVSRINSVDDLITILNQRLFRDLRYFMPDSLSDEQLNSLIFSESLFNQSVLKACEIWAKEKDPIVYWDIDDTMAHTIGVEMSDGSENDTLFVRPALKEIFEFVKIKFPNIKHGVLTSRNEEGLQMFLQAIDGCEPYSSFFDSTLIESCRHIYENLRYDSDLADKTDEDLVRRVGKEDGDLGNNSLRCKAVAMYEKIDRGINAHLIDDGDLIRVLPERFAGGLGIYPYSMFSRIIDNAQRNSKEK